MPYSENLFPWCIILCLPNTRTIVIERFRRRSDAEAYLRILRQIHPQADYSIRFEGGDRRYGEF